MPRRVFPTAILPLDEFGKSIARELNDSMRLVEPNVLKSKWVEIILDPFTNNNKLTKH